MTDNAAFLKAIAERPADPLPRLIYADWLDESGNYPAAMALRTDAERVRLGKEIKSFGDLLGQTLVKIDKKGDDEIVMTTIAGETYKLHHDQNCCECVYVEDINGELSDLVGTPLTMCEEVNNFDGPVRADEESYTWTFYRMATIKGYVTIRWLGTSNGYYSESVDFARME